MFWRQKKVNTIQKNTVPLVNAQIFRARVKNYHYQCGMQRECMKPVEMPTWALNDLASMGITMLGAEDAIRHAKSLEVCGIAQGLSEVIKSKMK